MQPFKDYEYEIPKNKKKEKVIYKILSESLKKSNDIINFAI